MVQLRCYNVQRALGARLRVCKRCRVLVSALQVREYSQEVRMLWHASNIHSLNLLNGNIRIPHHFPQVTIARLAASPRLQTRVLLGMCIYLSLVWFFCLCIGLGSCLISCCFLLTCRSFCQAGAGNFTTCTAGIYSSKTCILENIILGTVLNCHVRKYHQYFYYYHSGNYCPSGSSEMVQCPAGTWGLTTGLQTAACSGQCTAGMGVS